MKYCTFATKVVLITLVFLLIGSINSNAQGWQSLDTTGFSRGIATYTYLAFGNGVPHLAYSDASRGGRATVKRYTACGAWQDVGNAGFSAAEASHLNLAFDGTTAFAGYTDWANGYKATVMRFNGSTWQAVGSAGFTPGRAWYASLAVNNGEPYLAFQDGSRNNLLTVMRYNGSSWVNVGNAGFSDGIASFITLVFQGNTPYVVFLDAGNRTRITVMSFNGSEWVKVGAGGFSPGTASYPSLAFKGTTPYVAFQDGTQSNKASLMRFNGSTWTTVSSGFTPGTAEYISLAISSLGEPHIGFRDGGNGNRATVLRYNGTNWVAVDKAGFSDGRVEYTHLIFDGGKPFIAYQDGSKRRKATVMGLGGPLIELYGNNLLIENADAEASPDDHTDFGRTNDLTRTFTIKNPGTSTLAICAINLIGASATDFQVSNTPISVEPGKSEVFQVRFRPTASGVRQATVLIRSNAPETQIYTFVINGRRPTDPKIVLRGNNQIIPNNKLIATTTDLTDFGAIPTQLTRAFQIQNTGNDTLIISNITIFGSSDFTLQSLPTRVNENQSAALLINFTPTRKGEQTAEVLISSNDESNPSYRFAIKANTIADIRVTGNGQNIISGDFSPSLNDHTIFEQLDIGQSFSREYTITNPAAADSLVISSISLNVSDFRVETAPNAVAPGQSAALRIIFTPTQVGRITANLNIKHNAGADYVFAISGAGCLPPPTNASDIVFRQIPNNSFTISWANGGGQRRLVLLKAGSPVTEAPRNGQVYVANSDFSSDTLVSLIGEAKVVFNGTQNRVTVTGLKQGVNYYAAVYEYNLSSGDCELRYATGAFSAPATGLDFADLISVYPNPVQNTLQIALPGKANLTLFTLEGIEVLRRQMEDFEAIDLAKLKRGLYLLKVDNGSAQAVIKLVLE